MWFDVGVMIGEGLDAVGRETLLSNPLEGLPLEPFVLTHAGGNHHLPRLAGIAAIGEEQDELALSILDFDGTEAFAVAGDVHHHHRAVAKEVEGMSHRAFVPVPVEEFQLHTLPLAALVADAFGDAFADIVHLGTGYKDVFGLLHQAEAVGVVAVEMGKDDIVDVGGLQPHGGKLLVYGLSLLQAALVHHIQLPAPERLDLCLEVVHSVGAHLAVPAGIHEDATIGVLNEIDTHRQPHPLALRGCQSGGFQHAAMVAPERKVG